MARSGSEDTEEAVTKEQLRAPEVRFLNNPYASIQKKSMEFSL